MKLILSVLAIVICFFTVPPDSLSQVSNDTKITNVSTDLGTKSLVILYTKAMSRNRLDNANKSEFIISESEREAAIAYDLSAKKEFGSYVNPHDNQMRIVPTDDIIYTKVQIIKKGTGISVVKKKISSGSNLIDMSSIDPGQYILIMTNDKRNIFSEEITIL